MADILVIEDDKELAELVKINLQDENYEVTTIHSGIDGFLEATNNKFDLIILDLMLPGMGGMEVCKKLRSNRISTLILMLTSKSDEVDKILGLESGADDYMTKPFSVRELQARVKAMIRRKSMGEEDKNVEIPVIYAEDLVIDVNKHKVELDGDRLNLTPKEFDMLCLMAQNPGKTYSRSELLQKVWGHEFAGYEHTVNTHINRLRNKLEKDAQEPRYILTTWGVGYRFSEEL